MRYFSARKFGVELEIGNETSQEYIDMAISMAGDFYGRPCKTYVSGWGQSIDNDYWHIKRDGTCGVLGKPYDFGWEIASPVSSGWNDLSFIGSLANFLKLCGLKTNLNCGFHIHADVSDFEPFNMGLLIIRWLKIEKYLLQAVPNHRRDNIHCKPHYKSKKFNSLLKKDNPSAWFVWDTFRPTNFMPYENPQKRCTLNFVNYAKYLYCEQFELDTSECRKTLELRIPEGTLECDDIINWVRFFINFIDCSRRTKKESTLDFVKTEKQFLNFCGLSGELSSGLNSTKDWLIKRTKMFSD